MQTSRGFRIRQLPSLESPVLSENRYNEKPKNSNGAKSSQNDLQIKVYNQEKNHYHVRF